MISYKSTGTLSQMKRTTTCNLCQVMSTFSLSAAGYKSCLDVTEIAIDLDGAFCFLSAPLSCLSLSLSPLSSESLSFSPCVSLCPSIFSPFLSPVSLSLSLFLSLPSLLSLSLFSQSFVVSQGIWSARQLLRKEHHIPVPLAPKASWV